MKSQGRAMMKGDCNSFLKLSSLHFLGPIVLEIKKFGFEFDIGLQ